MVTLSQFEGAYQISYSQTTSVALTFAGISSTHHQKCDNIGMSACFPDTTHQPIQYVLGGERGDFFS